MKKVIIVLSFLCVLFLTGCTALDVLFGEVEEVGCNFVSGKTQDHCYKDAANRQNDADVCAKVKGLSEVGNAPRHQCYQDLAMTNKDPSYCDKIVDPDMFSTTKESCKKAVAYVMGQKPEQTSNTEQNKGQCKFDSDCSTLCEGNTFWKQGCNAQTDKCEKTFDTPCILEKISDFEFQQLCTKTGCIRNKPAIESKIDELTQKGNQYSKDMQRLTEYQQIATKRCLSALEDVTNKLIIDTATSMASPIPSLAEIGAARSVDAIEKLTEKQMSAEEFIALHCSLEKSLGTDLRLVEKQREIVLQQMRDLRAAANA